MTITITGTLILAVILALALFMVAASLLVMGAFTDPGAQPVGKVVSFVLAALIAAGAVLLVCTGGGWL